ncbi:MAG: hypothetical protein Q8Q36_01720 [bacterium]|nr:hypothetical protein [bacterium]
MAGTEGMTLVVRSGMTAEDCIRIFSVRREGNEIEATSLDRFPGKTVVFRRIDGGWAPLFPDPFTGTPCCSLRAMPFRIDAVPPDWYRSLI